MKQDSLRCYHATQTGTQFKICEWLIFGIFYSIFSDCGWIQSNKSIEFYATLSVDVL